MGKPAYGLLTIDTTVEDLAMVIERDAVIAVKVLATANSPFYRSDSHINSIHETVVRLGFKVTRNLILTIANKSLYQVKNKFFRQFMEKIWKHSLTTAHCAKAIADEKRFLNADLFYTAGLVHDIGKTILFRFLGDILTENNPFNELDIFTCTELHSREMGDTILRHWGFPDKFVNAITMEHNDDVNDGANKVSLVIDAANMMTRNMGYDLMDDLVDLSTLDSVKLLDMDLNTLNKIIENVKTMVESSENIF